MKKTKAILNHPFYLIFLLLFFSSQLICQNPPTIFSSAEKHKQKGEMQKAKVLYQKTADSALENGDTSLAAKSLLSMADCLMSEGDFKGMMENYRKSEMLTQGIDDTLWASSIVARATMQEILGQKEQAIQALQPVIENKKSGVDQRVAAFLLTGDGLVDLGFPDSAKTFVDSALNIIKIYPDSQNTTGAYQILGNLYFSKNELEEGLSNFLMALDFYPSTMGQSGKPNIYNNIGQLYYYLGQGEEARESAQTAMDLAQKVGSSIAYHQGQHVLGNALTQLGEVEEGIAMLDSARVFYQKKKRAHYIYRINLDLASAYLKAERFTDAENIMQEATQLESEVEGIRFHLQQYLNWYDIFFHKKNWKRANEYLQKANSLLEDLPSPRFKEAVWKREVAQLAANGNFELAYQKEQDLKLLNNQLNSLARTRIINEMQNKYNKAKNENEILSLKFQNEIQTETIKRERFRFWTFLGFSILLLAFLLTAFSQNRRIKNQNQIIQKSLKEKDTLLREIHHRVKNNLQVISSLLSIQSRNLTDPAAVDALNEGRSRVQTMSLIHQDLYQQDQLSAINFQKYFEQLIHNLFSTYNISQENIEVIAEIDDLNLDVDTVIPLGLILNELITNALKYAFKDGSGKIHIILKEENNTLFLEVKDDGVGIKKIENILDSSSYGFELIHALVDKLDGELNITNDNGTQVKAVFKTYQKAA